MRTSTCRLAAGLLLVFGLLLVVTSAAGAPRARAAGGSAFPVVGDYFAQTGPAETAVSLTGSLATFSGYGQRTASGWSAHIVVNDDEMPSVATLDLGSSGSPAVGTYPITYPAGRASVQVGYRSTDTSHPYGFVRIRQIVIGAGGQLQLAATLVLREAAFADAPDNPTPTFTSFGLDTTVPLTVPGETALDRLGDFDGDGATDVAVWRPSTGQWFRRGAATVSYGVRGDRPVPGDYDGDGSSDIAMFRPSTGQWWIRGHGATRWGQPGDVPVPGDYDGNGTTDLAVWRPSTGQWWVRGHQPVVYGERSDRPTPGDYDGNGTTDLAVFRAASGTTYIRNQAHVVLGRAGDLPAPGNYLGYDGGDGDYGSSATVVAFFRPSTGAWLLPDYPASPPFGTAGDVPVPGCWTSYTAIGPGFQSFAVFRPRTGAWYLQPLHNTVSVTYGRAGDVPV